MTLNRSIRNGLASLLTIGMLAGCGPHSQDHVPQQAGNYIAAVNPQDTPAPADKSIKGNLVPNSSLEISSNGTTPNNWVPNHWGNNKATLEYVTDAHSGRRSVKVTVMDYKSGDAKWYFKPVTDVKGGHQYEFSDWYKTNTQPHVVINYKDKAGNQRYFNIRNPNTGIEDNNWQRYDQHFFLPEGAVDVSVFMLLSSNGWLQVDDYSLTPYHPEGFVNPIISLTFDDGWESTFRNAIPLLDKYGFKSTQFIIAGKLNTANYMTDEDIRKMIQDGQEIGAHTYTHPHLTTLTNSELTHELRDSQAVLRKKFGKEVAKDFASPYGEYDRRVIQQVKRYYESHRSVEPGFNDPKTLNPYDILVQDINSSVSPQKVEEWVNYAKKNNLWLVLVYHQVISGANVPEFGISDSSLEKELDYIHQSGIRVLTIDRALESIAGVSNAPQ